VTYPFCGGTSHPVCSGELTMAQLSGRFAVEQTVEALARPHGVVGREELLAVGVTAGFIDARVDAGGFRPVHRGVYAVGPIQSDEAPEMAAVLACGERAVLSHRSAAALWRLRSKHADQPVEVTVAARHVPRRSGIRIHKTGRLMVDEVTTLRRIRITTPARTVLDLASCVSVRELEQAIAVAERTYAGIQRRLLALLARYPGRPGTPKLRELLNFPGKPALARSEAEERFVRLIRRSGLPAPEVNVALHGYELDFFWRDEGLAVEIDGYAFHGDRDSFEADRRRDAELARRGIQVMRVTWLQITDEPEAALVRLAEVLALRARAA
jgi:very-short-patch-repair endonuclease